MMLITVLLVFLKVVLMALSTKPFFSGGTFSVAKNGNNSSQLWLLWFTLYQMHRALRERNFNTGGIKRQFNFFLQAVA